MPGSTSVNEDSRPSSPEELLARLLSANLDSSQRIRLIETALEGPAGQHFRKELGEWVIQFLPTDHLVPDRYAEWRPLIRDAMVFFATHLSTPRLAPKLVEQMELAADTSPEVRLLHLIAKVPGLQKLGQVLARNRHLHVTLRDALSELENGICDVSTEDIQAIIRQELGPRLASFAVETEPSIFFEASVSAVVRFTWHNPDTQQREHGVFKVMKPYIPACFAEDMELLARLAKHLGSTHRNYEFARHVVPDTFRDVRRLLQHEVQFVREQKVLLEAHRLYKPVRGVRVPRVIQPLCTPRITAMTEEHGKKITDAVARLPLWRRRQVCQQIVDKLIAVPLFAPKGDVMFHADPHAGNLLYDKTTEELVILDWALTERLTRDQRRHLAMLFLMVFLRDPVGTCFEIEALRRGRGRHGKREAHLIRDCVTRFIAALPPARMPGTVEAMGLLERIAVAGVRLPTPLIMLRKVLFTLDGILHEIAGPGFRKEFVLARHVGLNWLNRWSSIGSPLSLSDWMLLPLSTLLYPSRIWMQWAQALADRSRPDETAVRSRIATSRKYPSPRNARRTSHGAP
jgi:ubiquinone biosynthesis protein